MSKVKSVEKTTNNRFLNMYNFHGVDKTGRELVYYVASRAKEIAELKVNKAKEVINADAVIIAALTKDANKLVLIKQYRFSIDDYIYELPAGLVDDGENVYQAGKREMMEETGLDLEILNMNNVGERPFFTSVGLCDEACTTIFGYASGEVSLSGLEASEDLEVVLADKEELYRILKNERVAQPAGYFIQSYLNSNGKPFEFLK